MSDEPKSGAVPKPADKDSGAGAPEGKRTWRSYVAWAAMIVLIAAAALEIRAQVLYNRNLRICEEAIEKLEGQAPGSAKKLRYEDLQDRFSSQPVYSTGVVSFAKAGIYTWNWQGIRRYTLKLVVDPKDGTVWEVKRNKDDADK